MCVYLCVALLYFTVYLYVAASLTGPVGVKYDENTKYIRSDSDQCSNMELTGSGTNSVSESAGMCARRPKFRKPGGRYGAP